MNRSVLPLAGPVLLLALAVTLPLSAQSIVAISGSAFDVTATPPASLLAETYESGFIRGFRENTVTLSAPVSLDYVVAGPQPVAAGSTVTSILFHFDGDEAITPFSLGGATVTFDREIAGVIYGSSALDATDGLFGLGGTTYPSFYANRGMEAPDTVFAVSGNTFSINATAFTLGENQIDQFRVILVPEPATYGLALGVIALGLVGYKRFRDRRSPDRS